MSDGYWNVWITIADPECKRYEKVAEGIGYKDAVNRMADVIEDIRNGLFIPIIGKDPAAVNPKYIICVYVK